jgi:peptide chain release factor 2
LALPWCIFDIGSKEKEITVLEKKSLETNFWSDQSTAQNVMRRIASLKNIVEEWQGLEKRLNNIQENLQLVEEEPSFIDEIRSDLNKILSDLEKMEFELAFRGEYDSRNALLSIRAGAGGTESQDWAEMLMRMYMRWAETNKFGVEILDISPGEEAGIKSVTLAINGPYALGYLKSEHGVHRLVRLSPFDADHARHTSFALVEVMPEAEGDVDVVIKPDDLKVETFRSSGPGGQNMQKTSSAVRITHLSSGLVVSSQSERSQHQNKEIALKILRSRLLEIELEKKADERARIKGKRISAGWSNQIRSYILHPYKMVKDHRTDYQSSNTEAVLSGDIGGFIKAYLQENMGKED